ncbi:50S ribosomal protein L18 [bacterium]|nr:50S ribosomal protein L18 [bacterium]
MLSRNALRQRRHARVRRNVVGTADRPRLVVFRSSKHIYGQVIDDSIGHTLVSASSLEKELQNDELTPIELAKTIGEKCAERALAKNIDTVVFDRGGYLYHGRVAAFADGAREKGLIF